MIAENEERDDKSDVGQPKSGRQSERPSNSPVELAKHETPTQELLGKDPEASVDPEFARVSNMHVNDRVSTIMTKIHQQAILLAEEFQATKRKHVYITPLMFANMFKIFKKLLDRKNKAIEVEMSKYQQGITKLEEAKVMIDDMQI